MQQKIKVKTKTKGDKARIDKKNQQWQVGQTVKIAGNNFEVIAYFAYSDTYLLNRFGYLYRISPSCTLKKLGIIEDFEDFEKELKEDGDFLEMSEIDKICDPHRSLKYLIVCDSKSEKGNLIDSENYEEEISVSAFNKDHCMFFSGTKRAIKHVAKGRDNKVFLTKIKEELFFISQEEAWILEGKTGQIVKEYDYYE